MVLGASLIVADEIPFPVVLKIVKQPNFQLVVNELAAYRQLARLCIVVPKLIALMAPAHERGWVAMVIEDAGKSFGCGGQSWDQIFLTASERSDRHHHPLYLAECLPESESTLPLSRSMRKVLCTGTPSHAMSYVVEAALHALSILVWPQLTTSATGGPVRS
jgi:hypothetical protein